ncbi:MAG TPA: hypothetical protein DCY07_04245 [Rhodospirillaceae bacterium]|nr:hypothetical protein [Rhodospirillaceae bacterium]
MKRNSSLLKEAFTSQPAKSLVFCALGLGFSAMAAMPASAGDKTRIEVHINPLKGYSVETRRPDGWREGTREYVDPYTGESVREDYGDYSGRNRDLRRGNAPDTVPAQRNQYGDLVCPQGYFLDANIFKPYCQLSRKYRDRDDRNYRRERDDPHNHYQRKSREYQPW